MTDNPATVGRMLESEFVWPVRVYYEDTDAGGVVYYANYLKYAERARTEMLRHFGIENGWLQSCHGLAFVVRHISVDYLRPARLDDALEVTLALTNLGGASIEGRQLIRRGDEALVRLHVRLGCMNLQTGGAGRLPQDVRERLSPQLAGPE